MNIIKSTLLVLLASIMPLTAQLTVPCGTVINFNVTVDACDILRFPTGANFFDANLDPYVNGLTLTAMEGTDVLYFLDGTDCLNPKKGLVSDIVTLALGCVNICGTLNTIAMFTPDGSSVGDSNMTQNPCTGSITIGGTGDLFMPNSSVVGVDSTEHISFDAVGNRTFIKTNNIVALDVRGVDSLIVHCNGFDLRTVACDGNFITTVVPECMGLNFTHTRSAATGNIMIDTGIAANTVLLSSATTGVPVGANMTQCGCNIIIGGLGDMILPNSSFIGVDSTEHISFDATGNRTFIKSNNIIALDVRGGSGEVIVKAGFFLKLEAADGKFVRLDTLEGMSANFTQTFTPMAGSLALTGQSAVVTILVDFAPQSSGAVVNLQAYEFTVASGASGDFDNVVSGTLNGVIPIGTTFKANASATPTNYDGATIEPVVLVTSPTMRLSSTTAVAADAEFKLSTSELITGQVVELEWTHSTNKAELLQAGIFKMSADYRPDEFHTVVLRYNGTNFIERTRSANQ